jgi:hypothetical protein
MVPQAFETESPLSYDTEKGSAPSAREASSKTGGLLFRETAPRALFCLTQDFLPRTLLIRLIRRKEFDYFILFVIVSNAVLMALDNPLKDPEQWQLDMDMVFNIIFTCARLSLLHGLNFLVCLTRPSRSPQP